MLMAIRPVTPKDAAGMRAIYNYCMLYPNCQTTPFNLCTSICDFNLEGILRFIPSGMIIIILTEHADTKNSIIPEDQDEVLEEDIMGIIQLCQREKMPCVVAIKGNAPALQTQPSFGKPSKSSLPQFETIVGFGFAQTYGYGIGGIREGRSRTTAELQFYVHHEYTRKGIGRSLLDRLIQSMSHSYA